MSPEHRCVRFHDTILQMQREVCGIKLDSFLPLSPAAQLEQIMPLLLDWLWGGAHVDHEQAGALSVFSLFSSFLHISSYFYCFWSTHGPLCHVAVRP